MRSEEFPVDTAQRRLLQLFENGYSAGIYGRSFRKHGVSPQAVALDIGAEIEYLEDRDLYVFKPGN
jgi:hypothetical protein